MEPDSERRAYVLLGAGGFVAPKHLRAISDTNGILKAALDPSDSVGILDSYFPECRFFVDFERLDRHVDKLQRSESPIDFVSICSPNYLHDAHCRFALRSGADAICEKPLVMNPWNIDALALVEERTGKRINNILQLRLHPAISKLKNELTGDKSERVHDVDLTYITPRGPWYHVSWKGNDERSGGIATNIGVHFFDMLVYLFGECQKSIVHYKDRYRASGYQEYKHARVRWYLSIDSTDLLEIQPDGQRPFRSVTLNGVEIEFSDGFTDLHTESYKNIIEGKGFTLEDARPAIETVANIRSSAPDPRNGDCHPLAARFLR